MNKKIKDLHKKKIDEALDRLVNLGILDKEEIKGEIYYVDSKISKKIDNTTSRGAFLLGVKAENKRIREVVETQINENEAFKLECYRYDSEENTEYVDQRIEALNRLLKELGGEDEM